MDIETVVYANGKWGLRVENEEGISFYRNPDHELYLFDSEEEALEHLETFTVSMLYGERLKKRDKPLSGKALAEAAKKNLEKLSKEKDV